MDADADEVTMTFLTPGFLVLLLMPIYILVRHFLFNKKTKSSAVAYSSVALLRGISDSDLLSRIMRHASVVIRSLMLALIVIALARPQSGRTESKRSTDGLDIMMVVDTSGSMKAQDFVINGERPTRLEVIKAVITKFIIERPDDRIGMVVFGTEAFTQAPLTLDHDVLIRFLDQVKISMAGDATAIGDGLGTALKRMKDVEAKGKVVILMTDGTNNAGRLDPVAAAEAAKSLGIRVYTVGVGKEGTAPMRIDGQMRQVPVEIDEVLLKKIAEISNGKFFRATDTETLIQVYETIDRLEKTRAEIKQFRNYEERFAWFIWPAVFLLFSELGVSMTRFRKIP